jgi:hypothetical protein
LNERSEEELHHLLGSAVSLFLCVSGGAWQKFSGKPVSKCVIRTYFCKPDEAARDPTACLGISDSNSEMSPQIICLKGRTNFRESSRILATETIRV